MTSEPRDSADPRGSPRPDGLLEADSYPDALIATTAEGIVLAWNLGAERIFGYSRDDAMARDAADLIAGENESSTVRSQLRAAMDTGGATFESIARRKDGEKVHIDASVAMVRDPEGAFQFMALSMRDVTRQTYLRQARVLEQKFSGLLEAAPDAMVIVNSDGRIVLANSKVEVLFGYGREELLGQAVEILVPGRFRAGHPQHRNDYFREPRARPMGASLELRGCRKDGTEFPVEISLSPMESENETLVTAAIRDVSERKKVEAKFRGLLEAAPDAMVIVDKNGRILLVNSQTEQLFGYRRDELVAQPIEMLVPERFHPNHPGHRNAYFSDPHPRPMGRGRELFARKRDGTEIAVEISLSPLETEDGLLVTAAIRDITERLMLEEGRRRSDEIATRQAQEANRLKSEFLANMSHELRTPLNAIIGFSQLMQDGRVGPVSDSHKEYLGDILTSARHLLQLINDVLDLAKVEAGRMEFRAEAVNVGVVVREVCDLLRSLAASQRITVSTEVSTLLPEVVADSAKLKQVLYNYLSNALKFTPESGRVIVRAMPEGDDRFRLEVEDTGIGIRAEDLDRLFVEFQQLDSSVAKLHQGTGLGLALTRRIVEAQGGVVGVHSTPGVGSVFFAVLPTQGQPVPRDVPAAAPGPPSPSGVESAPEILVIEDEPEDRAWLEGVLGEAGYRTESVGAGAAAIARSRTRPFAAITLDLLLPDMVGWDVLRAIRAEGANRDTPVVIVTAVGNQRATGFPIHDCLTKPVPVQELLSCLARAGVAADPHVPVLVVDDDPHALKLARTALEPEGYRVIGVSDAETALRLLSEHRPMAVILDLMMPGMDGFAFLEHFREMAKDHNPVLVLWTGAELSAAERARLEASVHAIVSKGTLGADGLLAELQRLLPVRARPRMLPSAVGGADGR